MGRRTGVEPYGVESGGVESDHWLERKSRRDYGVKGRD